MCFERRIHLGLRIVAMARLAQSVERKALNLVVVGSSPTVGDLATSMHVTIFTR